MRELQNTLRRALSPVYAADELSTVVKALCCELLGVSEWAYYLKDPVTLSDAQQRALSDAVQRLRQGEPLQYVLGTSPFAGEELAVDGRVLIPRPETAGLVRLAAQQLETMPGAPHRVLDLGTGSGCIAIALARAVPGAAVYGCDVSADALAVAAANAQRSGAGVHFFPFDMLSPTALPATGFSCLVSNPPYIRRCERAYMDERVTRWEPPLALFVPDADPLLFYRAVAQLGQTDALLPGGTVCVEINQLYGFETCTLFELYGYRDVRLSYDLFGQPRFVTCRKEL